MRDGKWSRPARFEFAGENLQTRVKEEDFVTDVKNTVLDFQVMKPLCFLLVKIDDPNITMEEYIRLEEERARRRGKVYNWETAKYGKIWYDEDVYDLRSVKTEFSAIIFNDNLTSDNTLSCEPMVAGRGEENEQCGTLFIGGKRFSGHGSCGIQLWGRWQEAQRIKPTFYDDNVISAKHVAMPVIDDEETLILEEEPPKELPKVSLVNESLEKLKLHISNFDKVVKIRTTHNAGTEGEWGFEHTKAVFNNEIIPFLKSLNDIFNVFDRDLLNKIMEELLVYVQDTFPNAIKPSTKKVDVTPKNKVKKVRFAEPLTSSSNIKQPTGNKKNDRISQTSSRNMKNKLEAQPRNVNKKNRVVKTDRNVDDKQSQLNANSKVICATCRTFTIVGNSYPLTRITSANVVPPKKTTSHSVETQKPKLQVYSMKPKNAKNIGSSKKAKIIESKNANHSEPNHTWGSNATDIASSSSLVMTGFPDCSLVSGLRMFKTHGREPLLAHELC
nr:hypothetical protein [Tanacetum cinerariifolium]